MRPSSRITAEMAGTSRSAGVPSGVLETSVVTRRDAVLAVDLRDRRRAAAAGSFARRAEEYVAAIRRDLQHGAATAVASASPDAGGHERQRRAGFVEDAVRIGVPVVEVAVRRCRSCRAATSADAVRRARSVRLATDGALVKRVEQLAHCSRPIETRSVRTAAGSSKTPSASVSRSRTNRSWIPLVSSATRFDAVEKNRTCRPLELTSTNELELLACVPSVATLRRTGERVAPRRSTAR